MTMDSSQNQWDSCSWYNKWTFSLVNLLLVEGQSRPLQSEDLLNLPAAWHAPLIYNNLNESFLKSVSIWFIPKLMMALFKSTPHDLFYNAVYVVLESCLKIAGPVVLGFLLQSIIDEDVPEWQPFLLALALGLISIAQTFVHGVAFHFSYKMGVTWKMSSIALVFSKLFKAKSDSFANSTGKLVNMISNDVSRFDFWGVFQVFIWDVVLEVIAIFVILIYFIGVYPALAAVGTSLIFVPLQLWIGNRLAALRKSTAQETDNRVRHTSEVIEGITSVKSFGWEKPFISLISSYREQELLYIRRTLTCRAIMLALFYCGGAVSSFATFTVFWAEGKTITVPIVFSTLSLLQVLRASVFSWWTRAVEYGSEAVASCNRLDAFLGLPDTPFKEVCSDEALSALVEIRATSYRYGDSSEDAVLSDISVEVRPGELVMVVGKVGAGKSSLLNAILGEMTVCTAVESAESSRGRIISPATRIAFCPQRPWILAASVRENIVFAGEAADDGVDEELYRLAVESCRIVQDMNQWPAYDNTEIGERGVSVSGGQKARIALARAVYSNADLCVLDDPLSAVDATVSKALFFDCIVNALKKRGKGVVLATHQLQYLPYADHIIVLDRRGKQVFCGTNEELKLQTFNFMGSMSSSQALTLDTDEIVLDDAAIPSKFDESIADDTVKYDPTMRIKIEEETAEQERRRQIIQKEDRVEGATGFDLYAMYLRTGGIPFGTVTVITVVASQVLLLMCDYWLRWWASNSFGPQSDSRYVWIFAVLVGAAIVVGFVRAEMWFIFSLNASSELHLDGINSVLRAPLSFFVANPTGRILNRFSKDMNTVDEQLPITFFDFFHSSLVCLSAFLLVFITIPYMICLIPPIVYIMIKTRQKYIASSVELKRIEAVSRSPIYSNFSAALEGLISLRAYKLETKLRKVFFEYIDENCRVVFSFMMINRWLGFRLDMIGAVLILILSMLACTLRESVDVGLLGFALSYMLSVSAWFQWTVRQSTEVDNMMTSVERLNSYIQLESENYGKGATCVKECSLLADFSLDESKGFEINVGESPYSFKNVYFRNLEVTYRKDLEPVLKGLSAAFPFGSKVGVCGRTGSGKSSLLLALLRLNIITAGDVLLDDLSLMSMPLEDARSLVSLIPQEPHLFSGNLRFNLDPFDLHSDHEIWAALEDANIKEYIMRDPLGLQAEVEEGGKNFSQGQRQLLSLARAILRKCPIVLMDEVSASIDYETDTLIQATIRKSSSLRHSTIFTIAHRLRTIADSDLIMVIGDGQLVECDKPLSLLDNAESSFRCLAIESNEYDEIYSIAQLKK